VSDEESKLPNYFIGKTEKKKRKKSMKQEDRVADALGGYRQKASGALPGNRGDVKGVELLGECKRTDKKSISITIAYLEKITHEAVAYDRIPAVAIEFGNTPKMVSRDWVMVPAEFMQELLEAYRGSDK
jgi:hypothetical protein